VSGQILIVDSSTDNTPDIVLERGGEVLRTPKRGLGRAYIDAIRFIRGEWIVRAMPTSRMTSASSRHSCASFRMARSSSWVVDSAAAIEAGSMPALHRYFGTPLTTWILNRIYSSRYSDIHCGMRGITRAALAKIDLKSQSWEYASEMVLKAARLNLRTSEVPCEVLQRSRRPDEPSSADGLAVSMIAGWLNLKVMLVYTPDSFLLKRVSS
jgi:hypothetical protein